MFTGLCREQRELQPVVEAYRAYADCEAQIAQAQALLGDPELHEIAREEFESGKTRRAELEQTLRVLLLPRDPNDDRNVILELRTGVGGEESALFAHTLYRMYTMYADAHGWKTEIANLNETELGGVREASLLISGQGAYSRLKFESGVHRVQRVPETETGGRIHTSTATVAVLPEMDAVEVRIAVKEYGIKPERIDMCHMDFLYSTYCKYYPDAKAYFSDPTKAAASVADFASELLQPPEAPAM